ncbi:aminodeoxychorismate lyase [Thiocapsa bogorovii]|uniref:aminodeoxychorismate lyase n=1 Tax=Thiocapsa bogorovii TaxID=521689 RepID=UPI001E4C0605|nr:aminodeoxychorismate lyase [Thiocapsa bogorovii]UHD16066.1 aminodeoxychorismate lyase [Thiocapsa bogorovii]
MSQVLFSFFRYPIRQVPGALLLMGFQRLLAGRDRPAGVVRLMGCGSGDGFSVVPDLRAYCLMRVLANPNDEARLRRSRFYRAVAESSSDQLHFSLAPLSGRGTWDGEAVFDYRGASSTDRPLAVLTHARVTPGRAIDFWRSVPGIRSQLRETPGCPYHIGFGEDPLLTLATFSVWDAPASMQAFAYRNTPHHRAGRASRQEDWLSESMFVRFAVERVEGHLERYPRLAAILGSRARHPQHPDRSVESRTQ